MQGGTIDLETCSTSLVRSKSSIRPLYADRRNDAKNVTRALRKCHHMEVSADVKILTLDQWGTRMKNRIEWIDAAKGLGIFLVVLGHALPSRTALTTLIFAFHMPLFFFLSGVTAKAATLRSALPSVWGLRNIVIPYLFFSIIAIVYLLLTSGNIASYSAWISELRRMAYGVAGPQYMMAYDTPLWFFTCLVMIRLCFISITAALPSISLQVACAFMLAVFAHEFVFARLNSIAWNLDVAFVGLLFFVAGHRSRDAISYILDSTNIKILSYTAIASILLAISVAINGRVDMNYRVFGSPIWFYVSAFSGIVVTIEIASRFKYVSLLRLLGRASIVIFPLHLLFNNPPYFVRQKIAAHVSLITHSDIIAAVIVSFFEIAACLPVYFAINRWAPFLIGQSRKAIPPAVIDKVHGHASLSAEINNIARNEKNRISSS
jgi:acyltransferase